MILQTICKIYYARSFGSYISIHEPSQKQHSSDFLWISNKYTFLSLSSFILKVIPVVTEHSIPKRCSGLGSPLCPRGISRYIYRSILMSLLTTVYLCLDPVSIIAGGNKERSNAKRKLLLRVMNSRREKGCNAFLSDAFWRRQKLPKQSGNFRHFCNSLTLINVLRSEVTTIVQCSKHVWAKTAVVYCCVDSINCWKMDLINISGSIERLTHNRRSTIV